VKNKKVWVLFDDKKKRRNKMINYNSCDDRISTLLLRMPSGI
jgi:hypothetical protein